MTYFNFLIIFIFPPILGLIIFNVIEQRKFQHKQVLSSSLFLKLILLHILMALIYTTPWDNYLVATGVWRYEPNLVSGIVLGWVPLEEYIFFVLETLFCGLWLMVLLRRAENANLFDHGNVRVPAFLVLVVGWIISALVLFIGSSSYNYLALIFFWAIPVLFPQFLFGADILWHYRKAIILAILPAAAYLSVVDSSAIIAGTWSISADKTTGLLIGGILPVEEAIFFFVTCIIITFGITLMASPLSIKRFDQWKINKFKGLP